MHVSKNIGYIFHIISKSNIIYLLCYDNLTLKVEAYIQSNLIPQVLTYHFFKNKF
jgi:hypothetical protein